jgi:hypothetical protein
VKEGTRENEQRERERPSWRKREPVGREVTGEYGRREREEKAGETDLLRLLGLLDGDVLNAAGRGGAVVLRLSSSDGSLLGIRLASALLAGVGLRLIVVGSGGGGSGSVAVLVVVRLLPVDVVGLLGVGDIVPGL